MARPTTAQGVESIAASFRAIDKAGSGLISIPKFTIALNNLEPKIFNPEFITRVLERPGMVAGGKVNYSRFIQWLQGDTSAEKLQQKRCLSSTDQASLFMERWDAYKAVANSAIGENKQKLAAKVAGGGVGEQFLSKFDADQDGMIGPSEYDAMEDAIADAWKRRVDADLEKQAKAARTTIAALQDKFVQGHIAGIEAKGYTLDAAAKGCLGQVLQRFFICDVGPAPFSIHTAEQLKDIKLNECTVTVSQHCLQMAMHWLRNPPEFLSVPELEELIVLALFHDVYYYDDFTHHGALAVQMLEPFLLHEIPKAVVGGHLHLKPDKKALETMNFASPLEALKQEWVQMDWYLTLVNVKHEATRTKRIGDGVVAPLEFFHHHLGHFFTKGKQMVIATANTQKQSW